MHQKRQSHAEGIFPGARARVRGFHVSRQVLRQALRRPISSVRSYLGIGVRVPFRYYVGTLAVLLSVVVLCLPSAYAVEGPGPTADVLGDADGKAVISVSGVDTHRDSGRLLMVTVNASGVPGYPVTNAQTLLAWLDPHQTVMPQEAVFPVGQSADEYRRQSEGEMTSSQDSATSAALDYATKLGVDVSDARVTMHVDDIGGPSAGMMYALGLIDKLTSADETGGMTIAGTGTMDESGKVGAIGGIRLKMIGAKRDGATWFLAPEANCDEVVGHVPDGLRDVSVSTLDEAYQALVAIGEGKGADLPHCTAQ